MRARASRATPARQRQVERLFRETVSLYWRLWADAAAIHGRGDVSGPRRTILIALAESGPQTVARLARVRAQSRQRIQPIVNALREDGLVEASVNPMHKQSPLIGLTAAGERHVRAIKAREAALLARLRWTSSAASLETAVDVLQQVRRVLEQQLPGLLRLSRPRRASQRKRG